MTDLKECFRASLYSNQDFIEISSKSGYASVLIDPEGKYVYFDSNPSDSDLGEALLKCLAASRFIHPNDDPKFFNYRDRAVPDYQKWVERMMEKYGYKTKSRLFKKMIHCSIEESDGVITITPTRHVKLEAWEGDKEDMPLETASKYNSPEEIGAALRRAMEKCIP